MIKYIIDYNFGEYKIMYERKLKLGPKKFLVLSCDDENEAGKQIIEGVNKSIPFFPKDINNIEDKGFWKEVLENFCGNRNAQYLTQNIWQNIVTPIEKNILETRGYPSDIKGITKYMATEICKNKVDDWNSIENLRIRTSEIIISLLQKQIYSAYNEYVAKYLAGDKEAKIYLNPTAIFSQVINSQNVQPLENINPLEELATSVRVTPIGIGGVPKAEAWPKAAMNTHYSYFGNIDPLETPDSPLVGIQQHLAMGAAITNTRGLFANRDRSKITPAEILSVTSSMIPFVESNEGVRVTMATNQMKQAIPIKIPEIPAIQTGYESTLVPLLSDAFVKKSPVNGSITEVTEHHVLIKDDETQKIVAINIDPVTLRSGQGKSGLSIFKPRVKVGQKVKKNYIVAEGANVKDGIISNGVNMLCAFMPWFGFNFEDGMVISESAAKKFVSSHLEVQKVYLKENEDVSQIVNVGDYVKKGDLLITYSTTLYDVETLNHLRADGGKIVNIEIFSNLPEEQMPQKLIPIYNDFKRRYELTHGKYPIGSFKEKGKPFLGIMIRFTIEQELYLTLGDKLNNRAFNKGVVSIIVPDDQMPFIKETGERIEMIYSTLSILNRMNSGQLMEMHMGLCSKQLAKMIQKFDRNKFTNVLNLFLSQVDGTKDKIYSKNTINNIKAMSDIQYEKLKQETINNKFYPLIFPPFTAPERSKLISAMSILGVKTRYKLHIPKYDMDTEQDVGVGIIYVSKLEHQVEKKIHARSTGPYTSVTMSPTQGKRNQGSQKLGEGDLYSLLSYDCPLIIEESFGALSSDHKTKNQLIAQIIQTGETNFRPTTTNPVKELFSQLMIALHLQSD